MLEYHQETPAPSSYHLKSQYNLLSYLTQQMGLNQLTAYVLLSFHKIYSKAEALDLFLIDENELALHIFIPSLDKLQLCDICEKKQQDHNVVNHQKIQQIIKSFHDQQSSYLLKPFKKKQWSSFSYSSEENERQEESIIKEPKFFCEICIIDYDQRDMVIIDKKVHNICMQCMNSYVKQNISNMRVEIMTCPDCGVVLTDELIRGYVDNITYNKYKVFKRNAEINRNPDLKWCPNSKCSVVISTHKEKSKTIKCPKCQTQICNKCNRQAHPRSSCESSFKNQIKNWQNSSDIQKCKKCNGLVEKIAGCNHMTCSICRYEWCWLCGSSYSNIHFSNMNPFGCPGLMDRPRTDWDRKKIMALRAALLLVFILLAPIVIPIGLLASGPMFLGGYLLDHFYHFNLCKKVFLVIVSIFIGLICDPFIWIGFCVYYIPISCKQLCQYLRRRKQQNQKRNQLLRDRLLNQDNIYEENLE